MLYIQITTMYEVLNWRITLIYYGMNANRKMHEKKFSLKWNFGLSPNSDQNANNRF